VESKLGLYDLLARLVPGGFLLWGLAWMAGQAGLGWLLPNGMSSASQAIAFVLVAYVFGLVSHALGDWVIEGAIYRVKGRPSDQYLVDESPKRRYRVLLRESIQTLSPNASLDFSGDPDSKKRASHEAFRLALNYVEDTSPKVQALQAQYGLHRSIAAACLLLTVTSLVGLIQAILPWGFFAGFGLLAGLFTMATYKWGCNLVRGTIEVAASRLRSTEKAASEETA